MVCGLKKKYTMKAKYDFDPTLRYDPNSKQRIGSASDSMNERFDFDSTPRHDPNPNQYIVSGTGAVAEGYAPNPGSRQHTYLENENRSYTNPMAIIAIAGGFLMILGVFLSWIDVTVTVLTRSTTTSYSGFYTMVQNSTDPLNTYPGFILIMGFAGLIVSIIAMSLKVGTGSIIMGVVDIALGALSSFFVIDALGNVSKSLNLVIAAGTSSPGFGLILDVIGCIVLAIGGIALICSKIVKGRTDEFVPSWQ